MMLEITGNSVQMNLEDARNFVRRIDSVSHLDGEALTITKPELFQAIENGLVMEDKDYTMETKHFANILRIFFKSIKERLIDFRQQKVDGVTRFVDFIWEKYDVDGSGFIEADETKEMLQDVIGKSDDIDKNNVISFLKSVTDSSDGSITKDELKAFIQGGFLLSKADRESYQKRSKMHHLVVQFFDGIDKQRIIFDQSIKNGKNNDKPIQQHLEKNSL